MEWRSIATQGGTALKPIGIVSLHASPVAALGAGENGGMNVYIRAVCEELSRRGIPTEVFTRRTSVDGPERVRLAEKSWVTRLRVGPAEDLDKGGLFDLLPSFTEAVLGEQRRRRIGYGLVHSHYWLSGWVGAPVVVFAGRLEGLKGAEIVIRAVALLAGSSEASERPVLIVIGADSHNGASESRASGGERARLEALARALGVDGQVRFLGSV